MLTIKLHEATKEFGISNKLAMFFLEKKNIPVKSHSSVISIDQLESLREFCNNQERFADILDEFNRKERERKKRQRAKKARAARAEKEAAAPGAPTPKTVTKAEEPEIKIIRPEIKDEVKPEEAITRIMPPGTKFEKPTPPPPQRPKPPEPPKAEKDERKEKIIKGEPTPQPHEKKKKEEGPGEAPKKIIKPSDQKVPVSDKDRGEIKRDKPKPRPGKKERLRQKQRKEREREREKEAAAVKPQPPAAPAAPAAPAEKKEIQKKPKAPPPRRKDRREPRQLRPKKVEVKREPPKPKEKVYHLPERIQTSNFINIKELAEKLNLKLKDIEERMRSKNKEYVTNQTLAVQDIEEICAEFKVKVDIVSYEEEIFSSHIKKLKAELSSRAPVVTVMGHVDHGKTTLLDTLRHSRVAAREAGGITQKIGAYKLTFEGNEIIFIDTPGHEAFTNIRARGAQVTDVVVLIVAANDGVQPQTVEAINHARAAGVPIVVAINKIDIDGADANKVKQELTKHEIVVEDWGGDVVCVEISAKLGKNLEALLEMLALVSDMLELKAYKNIPARGTIIESRLDPKLGPLGTVLLQHGKVKRGDFFICGNSVGKVKSIFNDQGDVTQEGQVPEPVEIMGFEDVPEAGELFQVTDDIEKARKVVDLRKQIGKEARKDEAFTEKKLSLQNLFDKLEADKTKTFPIIIKTDNYSSCEVLEKILLKQSQEQLKINIIHKGVGNITESDILLAATSEAMVVGFNVKTPQKLMSLAKREQVEVKLYNVIYHLIEEIERAVKGEIAPEYIETMIGKVEVLQIFKISKIGIIAGCLVKEGKVTNKSKVKVLRRNDLLFEGELETLKRVKNEAAEVNAGTECGIKIKNFNAIEVGDLLEIYETRVKE